MAARTSPTTVIFFGTLFSVLFATWIQLAGSNFGHSWQVYAASCLIGISNAALSISTLSLVSELTTECSNMASFVFGVFSFTDQLLNGVTVFVLESILPEPDIEAENSFYQVIVVAASFISSVFIIGLTSLEVKMREPMSIVKIPCSEENDLEDIPLDDPN